MDDRDRLNRILKKGYCGEILHGNAGPGLRRRLLESIERLSEFGKTGIPVIAYISAWRDDKRIWYEYAPESFTDLLGCAPKELAARMGESVVERSTYRREGRNPRISKETSSASSLESRRKRLRAKGEESGVIEAVYKIRPRVGEFVWLKDQAVVERFPGDGITLSFGHLTVVTKEMEAEEERARLLAELEEALMRVRVLSGLLPICSCCKKVRDEGGSWRQIEEYIRENSEASFSHGYCPDCFDRAKKELGRLEIPLD